MKGLGTVACGRASPAAAAAAAASAAAPGLGLLGLLLLLLLDGQGLVCTMGLRTGWMVVAAAAAVAAGDDNLSLSGGALPPTLGGGKGDLTALPGGALCTSPARVTLESWLRDRVSLSNAPI